jgi:uncharacterized membrane protein (DUF4010 family)
MVIGALGHIAVRLFGARYGLPLAGLASGFISSTATIAAMGPRALGDRRQLWPAAAAAVLSTVSTIVELALVLSVTSLKALSAIAEPLAFAGAAAVLYGVAFSLFALRESPQGVDERGRAFSPRTAAIFGAILAAILLITRIMEERFGTLGVAAAAALGGLANTSAAAVSVAALTNAGKITATDAAFPILLALSTNTLTKAILAIATGSRGFAVRVVPGLALVILAAWIGWRVNLG